MIDGHLKAAGAHRVLAGLCVALLLALVGYVYIGKQEPPFLSVYGSTSILVALILSHLALAHGARKRQQWARVGSIVIGFLLLAAIPVGTLFGIYLIVASWGGWPETYAHSRAPSGAWPSNAVRDRPSTNNYRR